MWAGAGAGVGGGDGTRSPFPASGAMTRHGLHCPRTPSAQNTKAGTPAGLCNCEVLAKVLRGLPSSAWPLSSVPHLHTRRALPAGTSAFVSQQGFG